MLERREVWGVWEADVSLVKTEAVPIGRYQGETVRHLHRAEYPSYMVRQRRTPMQELGWLQADQPGRPEREMESESALERSRQEQGS